MGIENVIVGTVARLEAGKAGIAAGGLVLDGRLLPGFLPAIGEPAFLAVRAEQVHCGNTPHPEYGQLNLCPFISSLSIYKGGHYDIEMMTAVGKLVSRKADPTDISDNGIAIWSPDNCLVGPVNGNTGI